MPRIGRDWIDTYFEEGVDYKNRRIFLVNEIHDFTAKSVIQGLKLLEVSGDGPIEIFVSTPGGDIYQMFGVYDAIQNCPCHVRTVAIGAVMSAGPLILTAGDERVTYRNTQFMVHETWWSSFMEKISDHKAGIKHVETMQQRWAQLLEERTKTPAKKWLRLTKGPDYYFDAPEALELGLVEKIISP